jgi:hypothetical protein
MRSDRGGEGTSNAGHETRDVDVRGIFWFGVGLVVVSLVVVVLMDLLFEYFAAREDRAQAAPASLIRSTGEAAPPEPRLQGQPVVDLEAMRSEEDALLESYGWIDRDGGVVRIPIDRAMDLLLERGLPARTEPAGDNP